MYIEVAINALPSGSLNRMLKKEEIIAKILQAIPNLTTEVVEKRISEKKSDVGKLLTDEGAAYMVANELGIDLSSEKTLKTKITLKDLTVGANNVTVTGKVLAIYQIRSFNRSNGVEGKVARIVISDKTGIANTVLWDEKTEITKRLSKGDVIRVNNGYVRAGLDGSPELNVGRRGSVVVLPPVLGPEASYAVKEIYTKTMEMNEGKYVNFIGFIEKASTVSTFRRSDGREGKVARARLNVENERITATFWDEKTDLIRKTRIGDCITIVNGYVRKGLAGDLEIHIRKESEVSIIHKDNSKEPNLPSLSITQINKLTPKMSDVDVLARVTDTGQIREFIRKSGEKGKVGQIFLIDKTGSIRLSLWDGKVEILKSISVGDVILVESAYTREGFGDSISLNLSKMGTLKVNPDVEEAKHLPPCPTELANIGELKAGFRASVKGRISEEPFIKTVSTRDGREVRLASLRIRDDTGEINASFWGDLADRFESLKLGTEIVVRKIYVKTDFTGELNLSSGTSTKVETPLKSEN